MTLKLNFSFLFSYSSGIVIIVFLSFLYFLLGFYRNNISCMKEDEYALLASFLDTQFSEQALSIFEVLSSHQSCVHKIAASGALIGILNILESQIQDLLEPALRILSNLSKNGDITSFINPSDFIPKLIPLFEYNTLSIYCTTILKNVCENEDARLCIAESNGCIALITKVLDQDDREEQEGAVSVLLSLCLRRIEYCQLVMDEGVIPGLVSVSINGNKKAKAMAMELLRILKDEFNTTTTAAAATTRGETSVAEVSVDSAKQGLDDIGKKTNKSPGLFGKIFSKQKKK